MPVQLSYPGVYIEELPSGQHIITGVPTSLTAFVGRTLIGPVAEPTPIFSFGDFQRWFGGLVEDYPLGYAVQDFFNNGGAEAIIVRLYEAPAGQGDERATLALARQRASGKKAGQGEENPGTPVPAAAQLKLVAANPGLWGNELRATVDYEGITEQRVQPLALYGLSADDLFNLSIQRCDAQGEVLFQERFELVTAVAESKAPNRLDHVLANQSLLVRVPLASGDDPEPALPAQRPPAGAFGAGKGGAAGAPLSVGTYKGKKSERSGLYALDKVDIFNLLCIPPDQREGDTDPAVYAAAVSLCRERRALLIVDPPVRWAALVKAGRIDEISPDDPALGVVGEDGRYAAVYFPRVIQPDPLRNNAPATFPPSGHIAGVMAATDSTRGVWKAPAGQEAGLAGVTALEIDLTDAQNGILNPLGINCLRTFKLIGPVVWGARTLRGSDSLNDDYKYVNVRRLTLFIEESLYRGLRWVVFEPNDETLWSSIRQSVGHFLADLSRQGAFYDYNVVCNATTTTPLDIEQGRVNVTVAFAPVHPGEFIVLQLTFATMAASSGD